MRILLVGSTQQVREERRKLLQNSGYEATAVGPSEAQSTLLQQQHDLLVLGRTIPEESATRLAAQFQSTSVEHLVIRVADSPTETAYSYADMVVHPENPRALLAAVRALTLRTLLRKNQKMLEWETRLGEIRETLNDKSMDGETRKMLELMEFEIATMLRRLNTGT